MADLSWDLGAETGYQAGEELEAIVTFSTSEAGGYYLLGGLYDTDGNFIDGTLCGLVATGSGYTVNSPTETGLWELGAGEDIELACRLTFDRTEVILGLFLMKMVGEAPSLENDKEIGSIATGLSAVNQAADAMSLLGMLAVTGLTAGILPVALKR